jgi:hypothetical protein
MALGSGSPVRERAESFLGPQRQRPYGASGRRVAALANRWEKEGRTEDAEEVRAALAGRQKDDPEGT